MLGENNIKELEHIKTINQFSVAEVNLLNFIIENKRLPNYVDEKNTYQIFTRLRRKRNAIKAKQMVYESLFAALDNIKVSNKLVGGVVD